jgi:hypothetical protein
MYLPTQQMTFKHATSFSINAPTFKHWTSPFKQTFMAFIHIKKTSLNNDESPSWLFFKILNTFGAQKQLFF